MKKLFSIFSATIVIAFALQSCNQPKVDTAQEWGKIDSMANVKVMSYRDSLKLVCMNNVMTLAQAKSDSMMQANTKKSGGAKPKPITPPKPDNKPSVTNRPGASNNPTEPATINDRPGTTTNPNAPKSTITNRPGATKADTSKNKPPKF